MATYERCEIDFAGMTVLKSSVFVNCLPMFLFGKLNKALIFHPGLLLCCWVHFLSCNTAGLKMFTKHCPYCVSYLYVFNVIYRQVSFLVVTQAFQMPVVFVTQQDIPLSIQSELNWFMSAYLNGLPSEWRMKDWNYQSYI